MSDEPQAPETPKIKESSEKILKEYAIAVGLAVLVAVFIRFFIYEAYRIPTPHMKPTLIPGDIIFVSKLPFGIRLPGMESKLISGRKPERGEVVVFWVPGELGRDVIKRVAALPGETVSLRQGRLSINGSPVPVDMSPNGSCGTERLPEAAGHSVCFSSPLIADYGPEQVPEGSLFLLPDDRMELDSTRDSRVGQTWGMIPMRNIIARATMIWFSVEPKSKEVRWSRIFRRVD